MKILAVEPVGFLGHRNFNKFMLSVMGTLGNVTFAAPEDYLKDCEVRSRIDIPIYSNIPNSKVGTRLKLIYRLKYIIDKHLTDYDAIIFLSYETISFMLCWPRGKRVLLIDHNNIDDAKNSFMKSWFYSSLPNSVVHIVFQQHIKKFIKKQFLRKAEYLPHPYYRSPLTERCKPPDEDILKNACNRKIIFSPSSSTAQELQNQLITFVEKNKKSFYAVCKGATKQNTENYIVRPYFEQYDQIMQRCHFVYLGKSYDYRVSGVAYEALSHGKLILMPVCRFARELHQDYPNLVKPINCLDQLHNLQENKNERSQEHERFLLKHSFSEISEQIWRIIRNSNMFHPIT